MAILIENMHAYSDACLEWHFGLVQTVSLLESTSVSWWVTLYVFLLPGMRGISCRLRRRRATRWGRSGGAWRGRRRGTSARPPQQGSRWRCSSGSENTKLKLSDNSDKMPCTVGYVDCFLRYSPGMPWQQDSRQPGWCFSWALTKQFTKPTVQGIMSLSMWIIYSQHV